ncbi:LysR substrate-binding domain-containing protein [Pseudomonas sp. NPDC007930]|uniref:LysR family transcriptional regulator n=1 Tax=Pseudomonas sp. NPDC007930 TaxID=3364417 RepID=UPI0036EFC3A0
MDLRDLAYFETIAELGHLGQAAEKLNRSQPALTKSIQRLEESLGARLFQRQGRRIVLTPVGELLLARGKALLQGVDDTRREIRDFAEGALGNIRLGCAATMIEYLLPELVATLIAEAPEVTLAVVVGQDDVLREGLRSGELDVIIGPMSEDDPDLTTHLLLEDEALVVASASHPLFEGPITLGELCKYRWILPPSTTLGRRWIDHLFHRHSLPPPFVQIETNLITLTPKMIASTGLLSFMTRQSLANSRSVARLREVPLEQTRFTRKVGVAWRRGSYLSPAARRLVQVLEAYVPVEREGLNRIGQL